MFAHGLLHSIGPAIWMFGMAALVTIPAILSTRKDDDR